MLEQPSQGMMRFAAALLLARYRSRHLRSRATCLVPITFKTGRRQIHTCIVCGEQDSFCPYWRMTKQVRMFIAEHTHRHCLELLASKEVGHD